MTLVIGNAPQIGNTIFSQGYTLAAVIANEFGEAANDQLHRAALIAAGLVLFVLTLVVNVVARGASSRAPTGGPKTLDVAVSADARAPPCRRSAPRRRRTDKRRARRAARRDADRARPAGAGHLLPAQARARRDQLATSSRPTRPARSSATRAASSRRCSARSRSSRWRRVIAIPIGIGVALYLVEYGKDGRFADVGALLRRRDDRRAVDRLRPVRLHHARDRRRRSATGFAALEGLGRARRC